MTYKVTAHTNNGDETILVEGSSKAVILLNAQNYFRRKYGTLDENGCNDNFNMSWEEQ